MRRFVALLAVVVIVTLVVSPVASAAPIADRGLGGLVELWLHRLFAVAQGVLGKAGSLMDPNGLDRALELTGPELVPSRG